MNQNNQPVGSGFSGLGIAPSLMEIIDRLNYKIPTPIQRQTIPVALQGKDLVGVAQTGTGKTLAFGIPLIQRLNQINGNGLIVLPTRELAIQVNEVLNKVGLRLGLRTAVLIGGAPIHSQIQALRRNPHIIVATPGRLNDHLQQRTADLKNVKIVVLDEADRMLDMGFAPQIKRIFLKLPAERQTMLFSATLPPEIMRMATSFLKLPIRIEVAPTGSIAEHLTQEIFIIHKADKTRLVDKLLQQYLGATLIFTRTKYGAKKLTRVIRDMDHSAAEIHSNRSLSQRKDAMAGFKSGKYRVLIATDIASRGIDVTNIELVINYDLPENAEDYVHRIGRTARAGVAGHAISLATPEQRRELRDIERLIRKTLPISPVPKLPFEREPKFAPIIQSGQRSFSRPRPKRRASGPYRGRRPFSPSRPRS
ncbi:MAG: ATP-dependent RNA helicase RhlE [Parcubacteria group bacterium Athens1014_10]|nr:MAG: ATP-dependent RNA helicase RhlE [Parcubacteria group bacterium Athens1014_10]TSD05166.1 MAG: ATP-dependent RNA helicase RhlE [Parcubacteria group bacterium Athens0714_12]